MGREMILKGFQGDEYVLKRFVGSSPIERACAFAPHEAEHAMHLAMWHDRDSLKLRRPEIPTGRLLLIRDPYEVQICGTETYAHATHHHGESKEAKDDAKWGGDSARWPQDKKLESMHPDLRPRVQGVLKGLAARGFQPIIFYGWRSVKVQQEKMKKGYSHVTFSFHNATDKNGAPCSYAGDIVDQRWYWGPEAEKNGYWVAVGAEAKANNVYWGGTWKHPDWAHVQLLPNSQLKHIRRACGY